MNVTEQELATAARGLELLKEKRKGKEFNARDTIILNWIECILEARLNPVEITVAMPCGRECERIHLFTAIVKYVQQVKPCHKRYRRQRIKRYTSYNRDDYLIMGTVLGVCWFVIATEAWIVLLYLSAVALVIFLFYGVLLYSISGKNRVICTNVWDLSCALITSSLADIAIIDKKGFLILKDVAFPVLDVKEKNSDIFDLVGYFERDDCRLTFKQVWEKMERAGDDSSVTTYRY
jgi:hypothetical protein